LTSAFHSAFTTSASRADHSSIWHCQSKSNQLLQLAPEISVPYLGEVFSYLRADDLEQWIEGFRMAGLPK